MPRCINCWIAIPITQQYRYNTTDMDLEIVSILEEWIARQVIDDDYLCQECVNLLIVESNNRIEGNVGERQFGHDSVCICCGISIARRTGRRSHQLNNGDAAWIYSANIISPLEMPANARACNACWLRAHRQPPPPAARADTTDNEEIPQEPNPIISGSSSVVEPSSSASTDMEIVLQQPVVSITLDGYSRTPDTSTHCFVPDCLNQERKRVPLFLKKNLLSNQKLYVTQHARVCEDHLSLFNWEFLADYEFVPEFNQVHILEMLELLRRDVNNPVDFEKVENMNDKTCQYWTGLTILNFLAILNCIPPAQFLDDVILREDVENEDIE